jgi:hypothetical protein
MGAKECGAEANSSYFGILIELKHAMIVLAGQPFIHDCHTRAVT